MQQQVLSRVNRKQEALQYNLTTSEDLAIFCAHAGNKRNEKVGGNISFCISECTLVGK